jgi:hypothetical protein
VELRECQHGCSPWVRALDGPAHRKHRALRGRPRMTEASRSQIGAAHAASLTMPSVSPSRYARHASFPVQ